jgi:circadian clock protein KaiC
MVPEKNKASTGVPGLDDILGGGLMTGHVFLLEGTPGTGKTTIALRFLLEGSQAGETCLYITLSETDAELRAGAASHGWTLDDNITVFELVPPETLLDEGRQQSLLYSSELELGETTKSIVEVFERVKPSRVVLDSLSEIRLLAQSSLRYRRQLLALKHYFARHSATVLMLDDRTSELSDKTAHSIVHGVIHLEELAPNYGAERRRVRIVKYRGTRFRGGFHDFTIQTGGAVVFPRLRAVEHRLKFDHQQVSSGIAELDAILGGGLERGTSTLVLGPAGTGKSLFTLQFLWASLKRGEKAAMFVFDEELGLLFTRSRALGYDLEAVQNEGILHIEQLDAAEISPGEFAFRVRTITDELSVASVVIDSLNGYQAAMPDESSLVLHIHELLQYLNRRGKNTFLTVAQHGLVGDMITPVDVTYVADTVILLRYFEASGEVRRAVSVIKKRAGGHENTIREYRIGGSGLTIGPPLIEFQAVLHGIPTFVGGGRELMGDREGSAGDS